MENTGIIQPFRKIDWRWVGIGYCLYIVYHLLPSYLLLGMARHGLTGETAKAVWLYVGLGAIGLYIGYRSHGITILEPAISALLYMATLTLLFDQFWGRSFGPRSVGLIYFWIVGGFFIAFVSAWVGELIQARKLKAVNPT